MKIIIEDISDGDEDQIIIRCSEINSDILQLISGIKSQQSLMIGYDQNAIHRLNPADVYYFDTVDNKTFAYCSTSVFEIRKKLYELEAEFVNSDFLRISKSVILNIKKVQKVSPAFSGRFEAFLDNGEKVIISRQYVPDLKKKLGI
ncbi:MAG: LytTR family DNA-binding domain-containing protein [Deltaproteobacteria bacterium]